MDSTKVHEPSSPRCGTTFIQVLDWIRSPLPEARFVCHGRDTEYIAYVPRDWTCPEGVAARVRVSGVTAHPSGFLFPGGIVSPEPASAR